MRYLLAGLALVLPVVNLVGAANSAPELELRLASMKGTQLPGEQVDLRAVLLNRGGAPAYFERNLLDSRIQLEINGEWTDCRPTLTILRGVVPDPRWQRIDPGDEALVGLGAFSCRDDSLAGTNNRDWSEVPGDYTLRVIMSHRMLEPHELERSGPAPEGAQAWTIASKVINLSVDEPSGVDAEALEWARENGHSPVSVEVATKFPTSRYGALVVWRLLTIRDGDPEQLKDSMAKGLYPGRSSVPDPSSPNGQRVVNAGEDMARWRIEHGERLLREQPAFPYERDVRLSIAVSYAVVGNKEKATQLLKALAKQEAVPESVWARRFLALQGW